MHFFSCSQALNYKRCSSKNSRKYYIPKPRKATKHSSFLIFLIFLHNLKFFYKVFLGRALTVPLTSVNVVPVFPQKDCKTARLLGFKAWI